MISPFNYQLAAASGFKLLISNIGKYRIQVAHSSIPNPYVHPNPLNRPKETARIFKSKHPIPKFRTERGRKVQKIELPDFQEKDDDLSPAEIRTKMKELGIQPFRPWEERPVFIASTGTSVDPYIPPEGDGKASFISKEKAVQAFEFLTKKGKSKISVRKIYRYEEDFNIKDFVEKAQNIYIDLHKALMKGDETELHKLTTERAFPLVTNETKNKTIRWTFHGSIEPPRAVHVRHVDVLSEDNLFAQITVRFHSQQTLAVYDRFGRLIHGSESVLRDVLEYVVFEKHLSNVYGVWRVHDKIIPPWMKFRPTSMNTFKFSDEPEQEDTTTDTTEQTPETESPQMSKTEKTLTPAT